MYTCSSAAVRVMLGPLHSLGRRCSKILSGRMSLLGQGLKIAGGYLSTSLFSFIVSNGGKGIVFSGVRSCRRNGSGPGSLTVPIETTVSTNIVEEPACNRCMTTKRFTGVSGADFRGCIGPSGGPCASTTCGRVIVSFDRVI